MKAFKKFKNQIAGLLRRVQLFRIVDSERVAAETLRMREIMERRLDAESAFQSELKRLIDLSLVQAGSFAKNIVSVLAGLAKEDRAATGQLMAEVQKGSSQVRSTVVNLQDTVAGLSAEERSAMGVHVQLLRGDLTELKALLQEIRSALADCHSVRFELMLQNRLRDGVMTFPFEDREFKFYLPYATNDCIQSAMVMNWNFWEYEELQKVRKYIRPGAVVIDAGANIGTHTVYFAGVCDAGQVHSFEPQKTVGAVFRKNVELNDLEDKVTFYPVALGASRMKMRIFENDIGNVGGMSFVSSESGGFHVEALDDYNFSCVDFFKIDVEGAQLELLKGARQTLLRCAPVIWIELLTRDFARGKYDEEREVVQPRKLLEDLGYEILEKLSPVDYIYGCKKRTSR